MSYAAEPELTNELRIARKTFRARILKQPAINSTINELVIMKEDGLFRFPARARDSFGRFGRMS